jgi:hypothetical protein
MHFISETLREVLKISTVGLMLASLAACGGGGSDPVNIGSNNGNLNNTPITTTTGSVGTNTVANPSGNANNPSVSYVAAATGQNGLDPLIANAVYAASHYTQFASQSMRIYVAGDNVVKLSVTSKLKVNDTVEFEDTIIKVTSVIADGVYGYTEAQLADVFSKFEIDGSMGMSPQNLSSANAKAINLKIGDAAIAAASILEGVYELGNEIKGRNCVPNLYPNPVNVSGDSTIHRNSIGSFTGRKISLVDCEVFKDSTGSIKVTQDVSVGMMLAKTKISMVQNKVNITILVDGAYFLNGKIDVNTTQGQQIKPFRTRLYSVVPNWSTIFSKETASTVEKLLHIKVAVDMKTVLDANIIATAAYQLPGDFAFGINAQYDDDKKTWTTSLHNLLNGSFVSTNSSFTDAGLSVKKLSGKLSTGIELGYEISSSANTPYFNTEEDAYLNKLLGLAKSGLTAEYNFYSNSRIGAGLTFDFNVGTQVNTELCRTDLSAAFGYSYIHLLQARAGTVYTVPVDYVNIRNGLFVEPKNTLKKWNLQNENPSVFASNLWCGPKSLLQASTNNTKSSRIFVIDAISNKTLGSSDYVMQSTGSSASLKTQMATAQQALSDPLQINPVVGKRVKVRGDTNEANRYLVNVDVSNLGFDVNDRNWSYKWSSRNDDIVLTDSGLASTEFSVRCKGTCNNILPIALNITTPSGQKYYLPFYLDYDTSPRAIGTATYDGFGMILDSSGSTDDVGITTYQWRSPSNLYRSSSNPKMNVNKDEDFYKDVVAYNKVDLLVTDASGQTSLNKLIASATLTLPKIAMRIDGITAGQFRLGESTYVSINGENLSADINLISPFGACSVAHRSSYVTSFACINNTKGTGVLYVSDPSGNVLFSQSAEAVSTSLGSALITQISAGAIQQGTAYTLTFATDIPVEKMLLTWDGRNSIPMNPVGTASLLPNGNNAWRQFSFAFPASETIVAKHVVFKATATELDRAVGSLSGDIDIKSTTLDVKLEATPAQINQYQNLQLTIKNTPIARRAEVLINDMDVRNFLGKDTNQFNLTLPLTQAGEFKLTVNVYDGAEVLVYKENRFIKVLPPIGVLISNNLPAVAKQGDVLNLSVSTSGTASNVIYKFNNDSLGYGWIYVPAQNSNRTIWNDASRIMKFSGTYTYVIEAYDGYNNLLGSKNGSISISPLFGLSPPALSIKSITNTSALTVALGSVNALIYDCSCSAASAKMSLDGIFAGTYVLPASTNVFNRWQRDLSLSAKGLFNVAVWAVDNNGLEIPNSRKSVALTVN